jgi:hypothetical protein
LEFFPKKRIQDWRDNKETQKFIAVVEKNLNLETHADWRELKIRLLA